MKQAYLECGKIINIHGFKGALKLESRCDSPEILADLPRVWFLENGTYVPRRVKHASVFKQFVIAQLEGIDDEDTANRQRGKVIYADRRDIPLAEGDFFIADLIGLPVKHADTGEVLGELIRVDQRAHGDLYTVKTPAGEALLPAVPQFVTKIDPDEAIFVRPIPGLLDGGGDSV